MQAFKDIGLNAGETAAAFAAGMMLEDGLACLPAGLEVLEQPDTALVTLHEGKYHHTLEVFVNGYLKWDE